MIIEKFRNFKHLNPEKKKCPERDSVFTAATGAALWPPAAMPLPRWVLVSAESSLPVARAAFMKLTASTG